jgi:chitodextrinase
MVVERAFLALAYVDTLPCCGGDILPRVVMKDDDVCHTCTNWNDFTGGDELDDMCNIAIQIGNPLIYADVDSCFPLLDPTAPAAVADLAQDSLAFDAVRLTWTAPGDDGNVGRASQYDVRHSLAAITEGNFTGAVNVPGAPVPSNAGTVDKFVVTGLNENTNYFFALKARDEGGNESPISNLLNVLTGVGIPAPIQNLAALSTTHLSVRLGWTATGDDGNVGRPLRYLIAKGDAPITAGNFDASLYDSVGATVDAGGNESRDVQGLERAHTYHFGVRARDDVGALSAIATVSATTASEGNLGGRTAPAIVALAQPSKSTADLEWMVDNATAGQSIRIYDLSGRLIRVLPLAAQGTGIEHWDGRDDDGKSVPSGMYIAQLQTGSKQAGARFVLLK